VSAIAWRLKAICQMVLVDKHSITDVEFFQELGFLGDASHKFGGPEREIDLAAVGVLGDVAKPLKAQVHAYRVTVDDEYLAEVGQPATVLKQRSDVGDCKNDVDV
jgi:hypothetical protein